MIAVPGSMTECLKPRSCRKLKVSSSSLVEQGYSLASARIGPSRRSAPTSHAGGHPTAPAQAVGHPRPHLAPPESAKLLFFSHLTAGRAQGSLPLARLRHTHDGKAQFRTAAERLCPGFEALLSGFNKLPELALLASMCSASVIAKSTRAALILNHPPLLSRACS